MKVKLYEIATLNKANYDFKHKHTSILYLDTANITRNQITEFKEYAYKSVDIPSRAKRAVENGTIIISTVRPNLEHYGFLENPAENTVVSTGFVTIDADKTKVDPRYLYYILTAPKTIAYLTAIATTGVSSYPSFNPDDLGNYELDILDSLKEQKRIANVLSSIDSKISLNNSIVSELESLAKQIYDYWFVQFDFPDEHGRPYKSSGGKMVWNADLKRHIPKDWEVVKLGDICESMIAGDWGKSEPIGNYTEEVFCIRGADIPDVQNGSKGKMPTRYILPKNFTTKHLTENNLVVEISGGSPIQSTGRIAIVTKQLLDSYDNRIICTNFCKALSVTQDYVYIVYYMWRSLYDNNQMFSYEIGTTGIKNLDIAYILDNLYIAIPPDRVLNSFNQKMEKILDCMFFNSNENESLTSLRDFLLPMLMNGQVTVGE